MDPKLLQTAKRHLTRRDEVLKKVIGAVGPCTLRVDDNHFALLVRAIVSQQISTKAAAAISGRLLKGVGRFQPKRLLDADEATLQSAGLSRSKRLSIRDLAEKCLSGDVPLRKLASLENEEVVEALTQVRGIGPWTAEMFLIFSLGRPDVLPVGDYGLRAGVMKQYGLSELPGKQRLHDIG